MSNTITATFSTYTDAELALQKIELAGITKDQVSMALSDKTRGYSFNIDDSNKAAEGATIGGTAGGLAGAVAAGLGAIGAVVVPGVNLIAAGPLVAAFAGAGVGGATGAGIGGLIGWGVPEHEIKRYEDQLKKGAVLVAIEAKDDDQAETIETILEEQDAENIAA